MENTRQPAASHFNKLARQLQDWIEFVWQVSKPRNAGDDPPVTVDQIKMFWKTTRQDIDSTIRYFYDVFPQIRAIQFRATELPSFYQDATFEFGQFGERQNRISVWSDLRVTGVTYHSVGAELIRALTKIHAREKKRKCSLSKSLDSLNLDHDELKRLLSYLKNEQFDVCRLLKRPDIPERMFPPVPDDFAPDFTRKGLDHFVEIAREFHAVCKEAKSEISSGLYHTTEPRLVMYPNLIENVYGSVRNSTAYRLAYLDQLFDGAIIMALESVKKVDARVLQMLSQQDCGDWKRRASMAVDSINMDHIRLIKRPLQLKMASGVRRSWEDNESLIITSLRNEPLPDWSGYLSEITACAKDLKFMDWTTYAMHQSGAGSNRRRGRRPGQKSLLAEEIKQRKELVSGWNRAKGAGVKQKDFCKDNGITTTHLKRAIEYVRISEKRAKP